MVATKEKNSSDSALVDETENIPTVKGVSFDAQGDAPIVQGLKVETPLPSVEEEGRDEEAESAADKVTEVKEEENVQEASVMSVPVFGRGFDLYAKSLALAEEAERERQANPDSQKMSKKKSSAGEAEGANRSMLEGQNVSESAKGELRTKKKKGNVFSFLSRARRETIEIVSESKGPEAPKILKSKSKEFVLIKSKNKDLEVTNSKCKDLEVTKSETKEQEVQSFKSKDDKEPEVQKSESKELEVTKSKSKELDIQASKSKELEVTKSKSKELALKTSKSKELGATKSKSKEETTDIGAGFLDMMAEISQSFSEVMKNLSEEVPLTQPYDEEQAEKTPSEDKLVEVTAVKQGKQVEDDLSWICCF